MNPRAVVALTVFVTGGACRAEVSLGNPDAGPIRSERTASVPAPPRCRGAPSRDVVTVADSAWGEPRALAVGGGTLYVLFARGGTGEGVLTRVPTSGGTLAEVAKVGLDPSGLALAPDASFVFVAARGSAQVFRVDGLGTASVTDARGSPSSIVAGDRAGAFWTLPLADSVVGWDLASGTPTAIASWPRPTSLLRVGKTLYITGNRSVSAFEPGADAAPRKIADRCDVGSPAIDGQTLFCADDATIVRVDLTTGAAAVVASAQPGAGDLVLGAGRVFWRMAPGPRQTLVMALPLDGVGGPTAIESSGPGALLVAIDGCDLYFTAGRALVRRGL